MEASNKSRMLILPGIGLVLGILVIVVVTSDLLDTVWPGSIVSRKDSFEFNPSPPTESKALIQSPQSTERHEDAPEKPEVQIPDISGIVEDEEGTPISGARVEAVQSTKSTTSEAVAMTAEDGAYALTGLRLNNPYSYEVIASAAGYAPSSSGEFFFDHTPREINFTLSKGSTLSGRVTDQAGRGIEGAILRLVMKSEKADYTYFYLAQSRGIQKPTDSQGEYVYENVSPGEYWLYVYARNYIDKERDFTISSGDEEQDLIMEPGGGGYLAGVVVDEQGLPVEGAAVIGIQEFLGSSLADYVERWCYTSSDGAFYLEDFLRGVHAHLEVNKDGFRRYTALHKPSKGRLAIQLEPSDKGTAGISGRVVDAVSMEPVTEFRVDVSQLWGDYRRYWSQGAILKTFPGDSHDFRSPDGSFRISDLQAHDKDSGGPYYYLRLVASGYASHVLQSVKPKPGEDKNLGDILLKPGASITGTVYELNTRNPVSGARVYLENKTRNLRTFPSVVRDMTDETGHYRLEGAPPGEQYITASHPDYAAGISEKMEIQESVEYRNVDFFLGSGGSVEGNVTEQGNPLEGVIVGICSINTRHFEVEKTIKLGPEFQTATDDDGYYRIDEVTPGYCLVSARVPMVSKYVSKEFKPEYVRSFKEAVELREGETTVFNIDICEGGAVGGKLLGEEPPHTLTGISIHLRPAGAPPVELDADGHWIMHVPSIRMTETSRGYWYGFEDVCPGDYTITAFCRCQSEGIIWQTSFPVTIEVDKGIRIDIDCSDPDIDYCDSVELEKSNQSN